MRRQPPPRLPDPERTQRRVTAASRQRRRPSPSPDFVGLPGGSGRVFMPGRGIKLCKERSRRIFFSDIVLGFSGLKLQDNALIRDLYQNEITVFHIMLQDLPLCFDQGNDLGFRPL